ncbi:MAG: helix-turn-helix transcriptional regulator [Bacilli bacterium]|nr:helix-turn-helix transcriptional regulator [Bacilli bacterium]
MYLGERMRELRKKFNYTLDQLSDITNIAKSTLSKYENDIIKPTFKNLSKLADAFNVSIDYLSCRDKKAINNTDESKIIYISNADYEILSTLHSEPAEEFYKMLLKDPIRRTKSISSKAFMDKYFEEFKDV